MERQNRPVISGAVEGITDEAVLRKLLAEAGAVSGPIYGRNGKPDLLLRLGGFNEAARFALWAVLVDLDRDADCAPPARRDWLPNPAPKMCFRIVVRELEAWLLADAKSLSAFLGVSAASIPTDPEAEPHPKRTMVSLAKRSRKKAIVEDMVPREGGRRAVGPAYASRLIEFVEHHWKPGVAAKRSDSLGRCFRRLREMAEGCC